MHLSLEAQRKLINVEAVSQENLLKAIPQRLPGFVASVKDFISGILGADAPLVSTFSPDRQMNDTLRKHTYANLMYLKVYVPAGLKVTYLQYLSVLSKGQDVVDRMLNDTLAPAQVWIGHLLTDPSKLKSILGDKSFKDIYFPDLEKLKKANAACFDARSVHTTVSFDDALKSNREWDEVSRQLVNLQTRYNAVSRKAIIDATTDLVESFDKLLHHVETEPELYQMSGANLKALSEVAYQLAQIVEFYSVHSYQLMQLSNAIIDTQKHVVDTMLYN